MNIINNITLDLFSPAKINLFLYVTGKRSDGYHDLCSLMCPVTLYDEICLRFQKENQIKITCSDPDVPLDNSNTVFQAADIFLKKLCLVKKKPITGVSIDIKKRIPLGAGLGGGSSNAATVLNGLNEHYGKPFTQNELINMSILIGADVPFFVMGKPAIVTGIGEKLKECKKFTPYYLLLIYPSIAVSTRLIFKNFSFELTKHQKIPKSSFFLKNSFDIKAYLWNDLESVTALFHPEINIIKNVLLDSRAEGVLMSGSGSTVFGLFNNKRLAQKVYDRIANFKEYNSWQLYLANMILS